LEAEEARSTLPDPKASRGFVCCLEDVADCKEAVKARVLWSSFRSFDPVSL
jgi:hypothetical protein